MSNNSSNRINVPDAKQARNKFKMRPVGRARYDRQSRTAVGHCQRVEYIAAVTI